MPQLHLYLDSQKADEVKRRAASEGLSVSRYLARLVSASLIDAWPNSYFDTVVGGWQGELVERDDQPYFEERDAFGVSP